MKFIALFILILSAGSAFGVELELLQQTILSHKLKFKKTKLGGLSGLYFDASQSSLFAVCDDRGNVNEPRVYEFKATISSKELKVEPTNVIFLTVNESSSAHSSTKSKAQLFSKVLDLEGISVTPWGDFLITNEGDGNKKPRVVPQLLDVKKDGTIVRDFEVPDAYLPELTGEQKKGVQNNGAFEGLAAHPNGKEWIMATEGPLVQDSRESVRFLQYTMPEAWVLKPGKEFQYPLAGSGGNSGKVLMQLQKGVSEITFLDDHRLLVIERSVQISGDGFKLQVQVFETDLKAADKDGKLTKKLVLDLQSLQAQIGKTENFEGMTLGPLLSDGRRSLILVSDDNFMRDQRTQFLLFAIKE